MLMLGIGRIGETRLQFSHPQLFLKELFSFKKKKKSKWSLLWCLTLHFVWEKKIIKVEILGACAFTLVLMHF